MSTRREPYLAADDPERAVLAEHGYDPDLRPRGVPGPPGEFHGLRNWVCDLPGQLGERIEVDGHSDPDRTGLCIMCAAEL